MPQVCSGRRHVGFMYSYPNYIPVSGETVRKIVGKLESKVALRRSAERYLRAIGDTKPLEVSQYSTA